MALFLYVRSDVRRGDVYLVPIIINTFLSTNGYRLSAHEPLRFFFYYYYYYSYYLPL